MRVSNSSTVSNRKPNSRSSQSSSKRDRRVVITPGDQKVPISLQSRRLPVWILSLRSLQRRFGIATYLLIAGMLVVYGSNVYIDQKWNQEYHKLRDLQRYERRLTSTNEMLKNQLASEAEQPGANLSSPNPAGAVILKSSSDKSELPKEINSHAQPEIDIPSGY
jgi:hypothetical protein